MKNRNKDAGKAGNKASSSSKTLQTKSTSKLQKSSEHDTKIQEIPKAGTTRKIPKLITTSKNIPPPRARNDGMIVKSIRNGITETPSTKRAPLRAVFEPKPQPPISIPSPHNVMNTIHNVTVISSPSFRKEYDGVLADSSVAVHRKRENTNTRSQGRNEVLALPKPSTREPVINPDPVKDPVAFEIHFEQPESASFKIIKETINNDVEQAEAIVSSEKDEYDDDDFDTYESDFESYSNSSNASSDSHIVEEKKDIVGEKIGRDHQLDSGLYDLKAEIPVNLQSINISHIDDAEAQKDSGFG